MSNVSTPDREALRERRLPEWYDDSKLGIFIHWGLFSVPGFAAPSDHVSDAFAQHYDQAIVWTPYTEWYDNALRVPGSPTSTFHAQTYGDRPYSEFRSTFQAGLEHWNPASWARLFRRAGARYVVLVTKHHDGYCLWPSQVANPKRADWTCPRDVVGDLAAAVRAEGLRFGVYYSGGIDWSIDPTPARTFVQFVGSTPAGVYPAYANAQVRELIERYEPSVLWNDIGWPGDRDDLLRLMADYYAAIPDGVVNDRWMHRNLAMKLLRWRPVQWAADAVLSRMTRRAAARGEEQAGVVPPRPAHYDFRTAEYTTFDDLQSEKWEATRGMTASFGWNRNDREEDHEPTDTLIRSFVDTVAKNGNLLLNVGPRGEDAMIPEPQVSRLEALGDWLDRNGEAVYETRPAPGPESQTADGTEVRFTRRGDTRYALLLDTPTTATIELRGIARAQEVRAHLLSGEREVRTEPVAEDRLLLTLSAPLDRDAAHAFALRPRPLA